MPPILIDTNILVYASDRADASRQERAIQTLRFLEASNRGRLSVQSLAEFLHVTTRPRRALYTWEGAILQVERLARSFPIFSLTPMVILEAARGARDYSLAYYDAQIWAIARLNQVPVIFSEDFNDGQVLEGIRFVNPFSLAFQLEAWV